MTLPAVLLAAIFCFRPILFTALAAMFGSWVITLDPSPPGWPGLSSSACSPPPPSPFWWSR